MEPLRLTTEEERRAAVAAVGFNLFKLPAERGADRLPHRLGDGRDVARPVGGHPARRRELRRLAVVVPLPRGGAGALPVRARHPHASGPRGGADPVLRDRRAGQGRPQQHALRHHAGQRRAHRAPRRVDLVIAGGPGPGGAAPVQGQHGHRRARAAARRARRRRAGRLRHDHEQLRRRPAGVAGEPARGARGVRPARRAAVPRRLPLRRERVVHPRARGGLRRRDGRRDRARDRLARRRHDDERQEGPAREHRRLAGDERRRARRAVPRAAASSPRASRPTAGSPAATWRRSRKGSWRCVDHDYLRYRIALHGLSRRRAARRPACRSCSRSAATRSTSTRAHCCRTSRRSSIPGQALAVELYAAGGIRGCEIGTVMFGAEPGRHASSRRRWTSCGWPSRGGRTRRATSTT